MTDVSETTTTDEKTPGSAELSGYLTLNRQFVLDSLLMLKGSELRVFLALVTRSNSKTGECFPSYETIMSDTGLGSRSAVSEALSELQKHGLISKRRTGRKNRYTVQFSALSQSPESGLQKSTNQNNSSEKGGNGDYPESPNRTSEVHQSVHLMYTPVDSNEPKERTSKNEHNPAVNSGGVPAQRAGTSSKPPRDEGLMRYWEVVVSHIDDTNTTYPVKTSCPNTLRVAGLQHQLRVIRKNEELLLNYISQYKQVDELELVLPNGEEWRP